MEEPKDSLLEFNSSIFDVSDGHALVEYIRKKKGLRTQPLKLFDYVEKDRKSFHIEIQKLNVANNTQQPDAPNNKEVDTVENDDPRDNNSSPRSTRRSASIGTRMVLRKSNRSIGRRTLLKEFEKTLQDSRFLPPTCSTPLQTPGDNNRGQAVDLNIAATPILSDEDAPVGNSEEPPGNDVETLMRELHKENDFLLQLANEDVSRPQEITPQAPTHHSSRRVEQEERRTSQEQPPLSPNDTITPVKEDKRRTFTLHRDNKSGNLVLTPSKINKSREPPQPTSPHRNVKINKRLLATPQQKKILLSRFGQNANVVSVQKTSRIPIIKKSTDVDRISYSQPTTGNAEHEDQQTSQLIERLQKNTSSRAPVIVIPINQTFNQAPALPEKTQPSAEVPILRDKSTIPAQPPQSPERPEPSEQEPLVSRNGASPTTMDNLRLDDILTDDDSCDEQPIALTRNTRQSRKSQNKQESLASDKNSLRGKTFKLSLRASTSPNPAVVRELITSKELAQMTNEQILDLRKRNSRGELRKIFSLTQRESSMFDKQFQLELLRRSIQGDNIEYELSRTGVLPPPPKEFCDRQESLRRDSSQTRIPTSEDNFVDERSSDKVSLSQNPKPISPVDALRKPRRKKKKMSEQLEKYLEVSQKLSRSTRYLNFSKRKLYCKGLSDASSSDDSSPQRTLSSHNKSRSPQKSNMSRRNNSSATRKSFERKHFPSPSPVPSSSPSLPSPPKDVKRSSGRNSTNNTESATFKKPTGIAPKSKTSQKQQKTQSGKKTQAKSNKSNKGASQTSSASSTRLPSPAAPVEPENIVTPTESTMDRDNMLRRSKRERRPPRAYWSSSQAEFRPLFDLNILWRNHDNKAVKNAKKLPKQGGSLVKGTTNSSDTTSVRRSQRNQKRDLKPKTVSKKNAKKTKTLPATSSSQPDSSNSQNGPSTNSVQQPEGRTENAMPEPIPSDSHSGTMNSQDKDSERRPVRQSSEWQSEYADFCQQSTMRIDDIENRSTRKLIGPKSKQKKIQKRLKRLQMSESVSDVDTDRQSSNTCSKIYNRNVKDSVSNIQQPRLTTVPENSVSEVFLQQPTIVCEGDKVNSVRLSGLLMPPSQSFGTQRKPIKRQKNDGIRTDHDQSIAEASTLHVNKLFDQLKSSSLNVSTDATFERHGKSSGQVSRICYQESSVPKPKCKKLAVRVARVNNIDLPNRNNDRVCDSGFSSEEMGERDGDILLNWLKQILKNNRQPTNSQNGVAKFLQMDGFRVANIENLIFQELNGVDFAFYVTEDAFSFGYIRFKPKTEKKRSTAKKFELNFVVLCGAIKITADNKTIECKNGDLITVSIGTTYSMKNTSNDPALLMVIKK